MARERMLEPDDSLTPITESDLETITVRDSLTTTAEMPVSGPGPIEALRIGANGRQSLAYRNWNGETAIRNIIPCTLRFGTSPYHPDPQWLLEAWDCDKGATRTFAMAGFLEGAEIQESGTAVPKSDEPEPYNEHDDSAYQCGKDRD